MRLNDREKQLIKYIDINGVKDPKVYDLIYDLSYRFLRYKKSINNENDIVGISNIIAEELYLKVYNGKKIYKWLSYIDKYKYTAYSIWSSLTGREIIDTDGDLQLYYVMRSISTSSYATIDKDIDNRDYIENISNTLDTILYNTRYNPISIEYMNLKVDIMLSLIKGEYIEYFNNGKQNNYNRLVYNYLLEELSMRYKTLYHLIEG